MSSLRCVFRMLLVFQGLELDLCWPAGQERKNVESIFLK